MSKKVKEKSYPECDKLAAVSEESQKIGAFLDWLRNEKGYVICEENKDCDSGQELAPIFSNIESLLAEYFDINLNRVEKERREILANLRNK